MFGTNFCHVGLRGVGGKRLRAALLASTALVAAGSPAVAQDATWLNAPGSGNFNTGANWDTATVPTGTAFFDTSGTTALSISANTTLDGWTFNPGASAYNFTNGQMLQFMGAGIVINGGSATIANSGNVSFRNTSTAGNAAFTTSGLLRFFETSTAGSATITNNFGGQLYFTNASTAGSATIASNFDLTFQNTSTAGSAAITNNFNMYFTNTSTAGSASITNNRDLVFNDTSTAGSASITNNSALYFANTSTAGGAAITNGASGTTDFSYSTGPLGDNKLSAGSIAGGGTFSLGQNELTVGGNDLSTNVTGVIADGGANGGTGGSLVKTGAGTMTLSGDNTYTGGTTISAGTLRIGDGGTTGSVLGNITNNAALIFDRSNAITYGDVISGSGTLEKLGTGTLTLSGINTYTGATTVNDGTLAISGSVASGTIANNAALQYIGTATAGSAAIANNATLMFRDTATAGSAAIANNFVGVFGSSLYFGDTSTAGSAAISSDNSLVSFSDAATAGNATITSNGGRVFFTGTSTAGSAAITNNGGGQLSFSTTTTAGNATITNNAGLLVFHVSSTAGNATITNNATLRFEQNTTADNAAITNNSLVDFRNTSTAGNATITNGVSGNTDFSRSTGPLGDHKLSAGSLGGGGTFSLGQNELTVGGNDLSTNVTGVIADGGGGGGTAGSLVKTGTGTLTLSGINTYTGATTVNGGTLAISGSVASGTIANNATLSYIGTATAGSATIANNFGGTLNFNATSTAGSAAITNSGWMQFSATSTAGSATVTNYNRLYFYGSSSAGSATITSTNDLQFRNTSTAGNANITNDSYMAFDETASAGSATITNNDRMYFNTTSTAGSATITNNNSLLQFFGNSTAGSATLVNHAGGTVDFSASTGPNGDGKLSAGSIAGAGSYLLGANELTVGSNNLSTEVSGIISGTGGSLVKTGTGTLTLSSTNSYTGATTINGGTLAVNSTLTSTSNITVNNGGALGGGGTVGATTINTGGALAAGNSIGTLTVNGNLTFNAGGIYTVEVSPTAADRTNVTGTATLTGATVHAVALVPARFRAQTYTILNASGGFGGTQFAALDVINSFRPGARNPHLTYDANNVYLVLDPGEIILPSGTNANQASVAGGINRAVLGGATPPAAFDVLLNLDGAPLKNALTQISGETAVGAQQSAFNAANMFMAQMTDPFNAGRSDVAAAGGTSSFAAEAGAYAASRSGRASEAYGAIVKAMPPTRFEQRWSVWAGAYGGAQTTDGNAAIGTGTTTSRIYGGIGGADYRLSPDTVVGFALAGGGTNFNVANGGSGRADLFQAGAFARYNPGAFYLAGALAYGWQDVTTDRTVTVAGIDRLQARFNANTYAGRVEGGYRFATPWMGLTPYAAGQATTFQLPAYAESVLSGANTFALSYGAKTVTASRSELGLRTDRSWTLNNAILTLRGRAAWAHDFNPDRAVAATFQALPGASFVVNGAAQAKDAALTTASAEVAWRSGFSLGATFEGEFSNITRSYAGKGVVRYAW